MKNFLSTININFYKLQQKLSYNFFQRIVIAISSGQDSIFLLFFLVHFEKYYKLTIILTYCHHFWHQKNFFTVFQIFKIAYILKKNIYISIPAKKLNSEDQARLWRQKNLYQITTFLNFHKLFLGHTKTDQIETSLWNLVRGTGPFGFNSLKYEKKIQLVENWNFIENTYTKTKKTVFIKNSFNNFIYKNFLNKKKKAQNKKKNFFVLKKFKNNKFSEKIATYKSYTKILIIFYFNPKKRKIIKVQRPLLFFSRFSIAQYLSKTRIPFIIDKTNFSLTIMRNKLRLLIIPLIKHYIHSSLDSSLIKTNRISLSEQMYLNNTTQKLMTIYCNFPNNIKSLPYLPLGIKELSVKFLLDHYTVKQIKFNYINQLLYFLK